MSYDGSTAKIGVLFKLISLQGSKVSLTLQVSVSTAQKSPLRHQIQVAVKIGLKASLRGESPFGLSKEQSFAGPAQWFPSKYIERKRQSPTERPLTF